MAAELLKNYEAEIETLTLIPSQGGRFEITVNDRLLYSKLETNRHLQPAEGLEIIRRFLKGDE